MRAPAGTVTPMRFLAAALLIALAEMAAFIWVGSQIGFGWAIGVAVATALVGTYLVRRIGTTVLDQIRSKIGDGRLPGRELIDGAAILVAGAFLIAPGFITDAIGFLLLIPAVRALVYYPIARRVYSRVTVVTGAGAIHRRWTGDVIDVDELGPGPRQIP